MKKTLLLMAAALMSVASFADSKTYNDDLVVTVNNDITEAGKQNVVVENLSNGNINFSLSNFVLPTYEDGELADIMPVGNIELKDITVKDEGTYKTFTVDQTIQIAKGDIPFEYIKDVIVIDGENFDWMGPMLGDVPVKLVGKMTDDRLYVTIDINMEKLNQIIYVQFGNDFDVETPAYYAKSNWDGTNWEWKAMTDAGNNNYTLTANWGGVGVNINTTNSDAGSQWFAKADINFSNNAAPEVGTECVFTYNANANTVSATYQGAAGVTKYYIKHPWNNGSWTWQLMTKVDDDTWTYEGKWGGVGCNINTLSDDSGATWFPEANIDFEGTPAVGDDVVFTYFVANNCVSVRCLNADAISTISTTAKSGKAYMVNPFIKVVNGHKFLVK